MKMLDNNRCVALLRKKLDLGNHVPADEELFISAVSVAELTHGAQVLEHGPQPRSFLRFKP
jgi:hypothetical protein